MYRTIDGGGVVPSGMGSILSTMRRFEDLQRRQKNQAAARQALLDEGVHAEAVKIASAALDQDGYARHVGRLVPGFPAYNGTYGRPEWTDTPEEAYRLTKMVTSWITASEENANAAIAAYNHSMQRKAKAESQKDLVDNIIKTAAITAIGIGVAKIVSGAMAKAPANLQSAVASKVTGAAAAKIAPQAEQQIIEQTGATAAELGINVQDELQKAMHTDMGLKPPTSTLSTLTTVGTVLAIVAAGGRILGRW